MCLTSFIAGLLSLVIRRVVRYAGTMRYPDGGGLAAAEQAQLVRAAICRASLTACCGLPSQGRP
jgi:hypothetical protein